MIALARVLTILRKDLVWATSNIKLLGVMILPVIVVLLFSQLDAQATFVFAIVFVNAFVGIFSTSYLIIEEKNKGTLLALLTTPLTGAELLLGKFLFNLILCFGFSTLAILLNGRLDLFLNPLIIFNLLLFAGTTCFFGYTTGIFFRNEQEMSVLAPFLMLLFCFGAAIDKVPVIRHIHVYFPDYALVQSLKEISPSWGDLGLYTVFSLILFAVSFAMASGYTNFYFSNNRENRFSPKLFLSLFIFVFVLLVSGRVFHAENSAKVKDGERLDFAIESGAIKAQVSYDPKRFDLNPLLQSKARNVYVLTFRENKKLQIVFSTRTLKNDEMTLQLRADKLRKDPLRSILASQSIKLHNSQGQRWVYASSGSHYILNEIFCGDQIFQWSLDSPLAEMELYSEPLKSFLSMDPFISFQCLKGEL